MLKPVNNTRHAGTVWGQAGREKFGGARRALSRVLLQAKSNVFNIGVYISRSQTVKGPFPSHNLRDRWGNRPLPHPCRRAWLMRNILIFKLSPVLLGLLMKCTTKYWTNNIYLTLVAQVQNQNFTHGVWSSFSGSMLLHAKVKSNVQFSVNPKLLFNDLNCVILSDILQTYCNLKILSKLVSKCLISLRAQCQQSMLNLRCG